jgi:xanthine dehydrogenase molybdopterin-binding subunit B
MPDSPGWWGVDVDTGEVRLRRMLGVFTAGRVLNQKTARSQAIGGMIFGVGAALEEGLNLDCRFGYHVNHDLAEYHVPVHADVPCPQRDCAALVWLAQHRLAQPGADRNRIGRLRDLAVRERPA